MSWKHYASEVVRRHRVILAGWPVNTFNIDGASRAVLETIVNRIEDGSLTWKEATDEEIDKHLEDIVEVEKTRRQRSDKGLSRKHAKGPTTLSPEEVPSDADDANVDD